MAHTTSMTHRAATLADCASLAELNHQLIRDEGHRNPMNVAELEQRMRSWLSGGEYRAILFEREGSPVAYALFRVEPDSRIYLRQFFVCRDKRRQGIGRQAVELLFSQVFPARTRVTLEVLAHNETGREFWAAAGFKNYSVCLERFTEGHEHA
jgi:GNAT superfamily N-acetyltransferase